MVAHGAVEDTSGTSADHQAPVLHPENRTHFRLFRNESEYKTINETKSMLEESGFYWGAMKVEEAHHKLKNEPVGTFLIRDSQQTNFYFTLSYRASSGPASVRIHFQNLRFSLMGSKVSFETLFQLLEHYTSPAKKILLRPCRKQPVRSLQELCRKRIIEVSGAQSIEELPVNPIVKDFLRSFPYRL
ncbi:suppressor of cytokine signaling 1a [Ictalurus furcatus]|uniref:suppressor of cytokine signaling 1a n=1 Tax=Ictalurus furcatus TaxID=66913 RepID=UPI0023504C08|nr:suppressor of cytokine signaling 1a [Ictalurus furcatus]